MKLDINALRKAVNQKLVSEQFIGFNEPVDIHHGSHTSYPEHEHDYGREEHTDGGDEVEMTKQNLFQLSVYSAKLHDLMDENSDDVEEWVQEKIIEATSKISDVYHYLEYQAYKNSK